MEDVRFRAEKPAQLLATQESAVRTVVRGIARIANENDNQKQQIFVDPDFSDADRQEAANAQRSDKEGDEATKRPHQVFLIDGSRGSGKTYTLLTIEYALAQLSALCGRQPSSGAWTQRFSDWLDGPKTQTQSGSAQKPRESATDNSAIPKLARLAEIASHHGRLAHTLRIIFPGDMEDGDAVMEAIFAAMTTATKRIVAGCGDNEKRAREGEDLIKELRGAVAQGWYFARRFGLDAIVRDSTDYNDLVSLFEQESRKAAHRIDAWRSYIVKYLKYHHSALLVVMLDDSDVRSELTENILHAMRMYLDHPRIVTVVAGNLKSMRISLLHLKMAALSPAVKALNSLGHPTAREWRRHERKEIEDYLEKILPPEQRVRVNPPQIVRSMNAEGKQALSDFEVIVEKSMAQICKDLMDKHRQRFLDVKFRLAIKRELGRSDAASQDEARTLEYFLSWWLFANRYREQLRPQSVRQLKTWKMFLDEASGTFSNSKRLPVMLFDNPANFTLIHRMSDEDPRVADWLRRQDIEASWVGRRRFKINDSDIDEGVYTYDYLKYRLDLGIAMPMRDNSDEVVSKVMLPWLVGRSYTRRFFQPRQMPRRHRSVGLARWLNHAAIPANCVYFSDLSRLPDISFVGGLFNENSDRKAVDEIQSGAWEARLPDRWMELIEDRQDSPEDEHLLRYLREIVFEALRETGDATSGELDIVLDPPDPYEKRRHGVYEHFIDDEWECLKLDEHDRRDRFRLAASFLPSKRKSTVEEAKNSYDVSNRSERRPDIRLPRMLALYSAIATDIRRAWHAIRIHQGSPLFSDGSDGNTRQPFEHKAFAAIANRDLMPLPTLQQIQDVLEASDWTRGLLKVFSMANVDAVFASEEGDAVMKKAGKETEKLLRDFKFLFGEAQGLKEQQDILDPHKPQGREEEEDFQRWTRTLRALCRTACDGWPVHDERPTVFLEKIFFREATLEGLDVKGFMLDIFKSEPASASSEDDPELNARIRNGRAGRNLVWLLWGLAPSLPAVIHANVMSFVYQAELERAAEAKYLVSRLYGQKNEDGSKRQDAKHDNNDESESSKSCEKPKDAERSKVEEYYDEAIETARKWSELVGKLAIIVRYVKIKCLQLDAALFLDRMYRDAFQCEPEKRNPNDLSMPSDATPKNSAGLADIGKFLEKCGYNPGRLGYEAHGLNHLKDLAEIRLSFWSPDNGIRTLGTGLAIHPDVAPSSLFGDDWMKDLFQRNSVRKVLIKDYKEGDSNKSGDNPLSVNGLFGEVEQWLWAASRSLRKLRSRIEPKGTQKKKEPQKATGEPPPQSGDPETPAPGNTQA